MPFFSPAPFSSARGRLALALLAAAGILGGAAAWLAGGGGSAAPAKAGGQMHSLPTHGAEAAHGDEPIHPLPPLPTLDGEKVALGRLLFHDTRLSGDNTVSCASCHDLARGGVDGRPFSIGVGGALGDINAPSVLTASLNFRQFWDGRAATLEEQAAGPVQNPKEMAATWPQVLARLEADGELKKTFRRLYPDGLTAANVVSAIADFERSLPRPSRFDRWLQGDSGALSADEVAGYQLFKKHGCVGCHQGANLGGNLYQRFGIMAPYFSNRATPNQADLGRFNVTGREEDRHLFKVPGLRNVALTAPYFHDGSVERLDDAVAIMARYQLGLDLPAREIGLMVAFLHSLTGETQP